MKDKFKTFFMSVADSTAKLSHATRLKVGAVIVKDGNIISFGYNGTPAGFDNECEEHDYILADECDWSPEEMVARGYSVFNSGWYKSQTKAEVVHAEANAITKLAKENGNGNGADLFITHAPCAECAKLIIQSGIKSVYWREAYRDVSGLNMLKKAGLNVVKE
jgi:dCMP deaminase